MALINLGRATANVAGGTTYTPSFLLTSFHVLTLGTGNITIAAATGVNPGDIVAIKVIYPMVGSTLLTYAPEYLLSGYNVQQHTGGGAQITYGFFYEGGGFQLIWQGQS